MINFIFVIIIVAFVLLAFSFVIKNYAIGMISSMAIMSIGVHILISGMRSIVNLLTISMGVVFVCLGSYIFIRGSLQKIEEYNYGGTGKW